MFHQKTLEPSVAAANVDDAFSINLIARNPVANKPQATMHFLIGRGNFLQNVFHLSIPDKDEILAAARSAVTLAYIGF